MFDEYLKRSVLCWLFHQLIDYSSSLSRSGVALFDLIDWDESAPPSLKNRHVNAWQVQLVGCPPLLKRLRIPETIAPLISGDVAMADPLAGPGSLYMPMLMGSPIPAGMQGARQDFLADFPSSSTRMLTTQLLFPSDHPIPPSPGGGSSEVLNPENGSPPQFPEEIRTIQLFGTTITSAVQITNGSSEEVNQVPAAVVDGTANDDAWETSPVDFTLLNGNDGHNQNGI